ncbi:hypothetical protein [Sodalinema gerasimenkoae]|uniref:hypothetical protein n=1 Tax=Sodalinema gerasimenkoae TaxID=2862348 RepID=UPI001CA567D3|nr:hypothetical protein [Sodalinema gerasimenkoae]
MLREPQHQISCLTLKQPWASLTLGWKNLPIKDCENRTWQPPSIKEVWIHAGKSWDQVGAIVVGNRLGLDFDPTDFPTGQILGKVQITKVTRNFDSFWAMGAQYYKWVWANPQKLQQPIPARGQQKIWVFSPQTKPYLPSNSADGYAFTSRYCEQCEKDAAAGPEGCEILALALAGEQPEEAPRQLKLF